MCHGRRPSIRSERIVIARSRHAARAPRHTSGLWSCAPPAIHTNSCLIPGSFSFWIRRCLESIELQGMETGPLRARRLSWRGRPWEPCRTVPSTSCPRQRGAPQARAPRRPRRRRRCACPHVGCMTVTAHLSSPGPVCCGRPSGSPGEASPSDGPLCRQSSGRPRAPATPLRRLLRSRISPSPSRRVSAGP